MADTELHYRTRHIGQNPLVYWCFRIPLEVMLRLYWRTSKLGKHHIPKSGPVIIAANHRSFFDPWVIGTMAGRRQMYYVAKVELFRYRIVAWILNAVGAFPVRRGEADGDAMRTARELLERGEIVLMFAEGTRTRPGPLGTPKRGFARLALETGAPIIPVAIIGTERIRRKFWLAPEKVTARAGAPIEVQKTDSSTPEEAVVLTEQVWARVELQWQSIGGEPKVTSQPVHAADRAI